jgi:hypothetical protein
LSFATTRGGGFCARAVAAAKNTINMAGRISRI